MAKIGTKRKKKQDPAAHKAHMELENIIEDYADAMRNANMQYIANVGRHTPGMEMAWNRYITYAIKHAPKP